jgi:hypothetical protein
VNFIANTSDAIGCSDAASTAAPDCLATIMLGQPIVIPMEPIDTLLPVEQVFTPRGTSSLFAAPSS